jgi:hypothetical protein
LQCLIKKKEPKIDLISDVIKFVSELNEIRYTGDTLLKTLTRVLSKTFIEKYEYNATMKRFPDPESLLQLKNNMDRVSNNTDTIDVRLSHVENHNTENQIQIQSIREELDFKAAKKHLEAIEEELPRFALKTKLQEVDRKFSKFAKFDYVMELNAKIDILNSEIEKVAKIDYVHKQMNSFSSNLKEAIESFITREAVESQFSIYDAKLKKIRKDFKHELQMFVKLEEDVEDINLKLAETV